MRTLSQFAIGVALAAALGVPSLRAQSVAPPAAQAPASVEQVAAAANHGIALAESGHCKEALVTLKVWPRVGDKDLKRRSGLAVVRCAMSLQNDEAVFAALVALRHSFPDDPDVLYVTTHAYSDLSTRAAGDLGTKAANSYQAHELDAEALEEQGKWPEAEAQYRLILKEHPDLPGIHFRIGRLILSRPSNATTTADARAEFEAELKIDPNNAGAEYVLGELAGGEQKYEDAAGHFARAIKLDPTFTDAYRDLGMAYNASEKFSQAVAPLESYVKQQPADPAGHYQLAIAYARTGQKEQASQQMALQRDLDQKARKNQDGQDPNAPH